MTETNSNSENPVTVLMEKSGWTVADIATATKNSNRNVRRWVKTGEMGDTSRKLVVLYNTLIDLRMRDVCDVFKQLDTSNVSSAADLVPSRTPSSIEGITMAQRLEFLEMLVDHVVDELGKVSLLPGAEGLPDLERAFTKGREMLFFVRESEAKALRAEAEKAEQSE